MGKPQFQERQYQCDAESAVMGEWDKGNTKTLLVLPTGTGKTIVFCKLACEMVRRGYRGLILAHRGELLDQAAKKLEYSTGLKCSLEKAESTCIGEPYRMVVGSVQSMMQPKRLAMFTPDYFDFIIVDEAHHALSDSYQRVLGHFADAKVLGVTATPDRGDLRELGEYFQSLAFEYGLPQAIHDGFLCPIKAMTIPLKIDVSGVKQQSGDFQAAALGSALDPYLEAIVEEMKTHCRGRKTVVFTPLIATSKRFVDLLKKGGFRAVEINGKSEDRAEILHDFNAGKYDVLCNSMLLTEGWDCPTVDCIIPLRLTKIRSLFCQMIGRGTRLSPGKENLLLIDFLWATERLDLCRPACLIAGSEAIATHMTETINESGGPVDLIEAESNAQGDCVADRENGLVEVLEKMKRKKGKMIDPLQWEMSVLNEDLSGYVPAFGTESAPVTDLQKSTLEGMNIFPDNIESSGKAELLIKTIEQRQADGMATPGQIRMLERKKFQHAGQWTFKQAQSMMARLSANNWQTPNGVNAETYEP